MNLAEPGTEAPGGVRMLVVAGPSGAGKSTLIDRVLLGECPQLCEQLGITEPTALRCVSASEAYRLPVDNAVPLLLHYDLYSQFHRSEGFERLDTVLSGAGSVTILTLITPVDVLLERSGKRSRQSLARLRSGNGRDRYLTLPRKFARLWWKNRQYRRGYSETLYARWFDYLAARRFAGNWQVDTSAAGEPVARVLNPSEPRPRAP